MKRLVLACLLLGWAVAAAGQPGVPASRQPGAAAPSPSAGTSASSPSAAAANQSGLPRALREVGFDQKIGTMLPLQLRFRDETGATVELGSFFGQRPVLLSLVYYECPMLCSMALNGLVSSLRALNMEPGRDFEIVTVSFDSTEGPALAAAKKAKYLEEYHRPGAAASWHFLTGEGPAIRGLTESVGFRYTWDEPTKQFAHASGLIVTTPAGELARYFFGIEYAPRDLRLGLVEASQGKLGNVVDQALLYCFRYDPESGTYAAAALNLVRAGGVVTVILIAVFILWMRRQERRRLLPS